jgi:hypothetical protein
LISVIQIKCITYKCIKFKIRCNILNLHDTEVERSPNLKLYTFVCNTLNLLDTEVERSPNLELYICVSNTLNLKFKIRTAFYFSVMMIKCITNKCIKFKIRTAFYIDQLHEF